MHVCKLTLCFHVLPAVDGGSCIRLQRPAATVSPGRLLGVPGQTHTAVHSETVADLFAHMLAPGGFCKFSIQQCQISNPCGCKCIRWIILIRIWGKKTFSALNHVFLLLRNDDGRVRITVSPSQRCVLLRWCMLGVGLSNILPQQVSFSLMFQFPAFNSKKPPLPTARLSVPEEQHDGKRLGGRSPEMHRHLDGVLQVLLGDVEAVVVGLPVLQDVLMLGGLMEER